MARPTNCPVYAGYCAEHGFTHGAEAEELREGVERILEKMPANSELDTLEDAQHELSSMRRALHDLLDAVDARDSLAFSESPRKRRQARERATERRGASR